jgi:tetratricopeptide (TPR) repeat protein
MRICITCLLILGLNAGITAQTRTDSLLRVWQNSALHDSLRLHAVDALCRAITREYPDSAYNLAQAAFQLAEKNRNQLAQAKALNHIGLSWRQRSNLPKAIQAYKQGITLLENLGEKAALADIYRNISDVYRLQSNFTTSIEYIQRSLAMAEDIGDQVKIADAYVCLSTIYYMSSNNLEQVESYLLKAKPLYEAKRREDGLVFVYSNLSLVDYERKDYPNALENIKKCIAIQEKMGDVFGLATSLQNRATIYTELGRYADAQADLQQEVAIFEKIGDQEGLSDAYSSVGGLYLKQNKPAAAIPWCQKALQSAEALGVRNISAQNACHCLAEAYERQGNYQAALDYLRRFSTIKDSLQSQQTEQQLKQMEIERDSLGRAKTELEKKQAFDRTLRQKKPHRRYSGILFSYWRPRRLGFLDAYAVLQTPLAGYADPL